MRAVYYSTELPSNLWRGAAEKLIRQSRDLGGTRSLEGHEKDLGKILAPSVVISRFVAGKRFIKNAKSQEGGRNECIRADERHTLKDDEKKTKIKK